MGLGGLVRGMGGWEGKGIGGLTCKISVSKAKKRKKVIGCYDEECLKVV